MDAETASFLRVVDRLEFPLTEVGKVEKWIRGRLEMIEAGIRACPEWFRKDLAAFDSDLRARWDFTRDVWVIERVSHLDRLYWTVALWPHELGPRLLAALREGDTWNPNCQNKFTDERAKADKRAAEIEKQQTDEMLHIDDVAKLSTAQVRNFIAVEEAIATGETIVCHGEDLAKLEHLAGKSKGLPPDKTPIYRRDRQRGKRKRTS